MIEVPFLLKLLVPLIDNKQDNLFALFYRITIKFIYGLFVYYFPMATDDIFGSPEPEEKGIGHDIGVLLKSFKNIFTKKFRINLIILIILLGATVSFSIFLRDPSVTGAVIGTECPENNISCPECPECAIPACEELNCTEEKVKEVEVNRFFYVCEESGAIVNESEDCEPLMPEIESLYVEEADDITFSIDDWVIDLENNSAGRIKTLSYTIINEGRDMIEPRVKIYFYEDSWADAEKDTKFGFYTDELLSEDEWVRETKKLNLYFDMEDPKVRFELMDDLTEESIVAVVKRIDTD